MQRFPEKSRYDTTENASEGRRFIRHVPLTPKPLMFAQPAHISATKPLLELHQHSLLPYSILPVNIESRQSSASLQKIGSP